MRRAEFVGDPTKTATARKRYAQALESLLSAVVRLLAANYSATGLLHSAWVDEMRLAGLDVSVLADVELVED